MSKQPTKKSIRKEFQAKRDTIIPELKALENKHGAELVHSAMRKHLFVTAQTRSRNDRIQRLQREIDELARK